MIFISGPLMAAIKTAMHKWRIAGVDPPFPFTGSKALWLPVAMIGTAAAAAALKVLTKDKPRKANSLGKPKKRTK